MPLAMTWQSAAGEIGYARTVAERLPRCLAALAAGKIHPVHLRIIAEETAFLSAADVAIADEKLAGLKGSPDGGVRGSPDTGPSLAALVTITIPLATLQGGEEPGTADGFGPWTPTRPPDSRALTYNTVIRGPCRHAQVQHTYRPSRKLRHLVNARNTTCTAAGCSQPAARCAIAAKAPMMT